MTASWLMTAGLSVAVLASVAAMQVPDPSSFATSWQWVIEWLRIIGGLLGMIVGGIGIWVYFKVTSRQKTEEAQGRALEIYKEQIGALEGRMQTMSDEHKSAKAQADERERELIALRARTDLSEVLKCSQVMTQSLTDLIAEGRKHDATITVVLKDAISTGQEQYKSVMELITKMLSHLDQTAQQNLTQATENHKIIQQVVKSIDNLSRRFGGVEKTVDAVADQVGVDSQPPDEPHERRKKDR